MGSAKTTNGPWLMGEYNFTSEMELLVLSVELSVGSAEKLDAVELLSVVEAVVVVEVGVVVEIAVGRVG